MSKKKRSQAAINTARSKDKYKDAGLYQIKVWVANEVEAKKANPTLVTEADKVRASAAKQPKTKSIFRRLFNVY